MKRCIRRAVAAMAAATIAAAAVAQDADFPSDDGSSADEASADGATDFGGDDYYSSGDDFSGGSFAESDEPALTWNGQVDADLRTWIGGKNGEGKHNTRGWYSPDDISRSTVDANAKLKLDLSYEGDYTDAKATIKFDPATIKANPWDTLSEASVGGSFLDGMLQLRAGKMKEVWGKGDKLHVLDNFNANDYTDFIFPDYIDRRLGEVMFKATANLSWDYNLKLEGIYTPWMTPDRFATSGMLAPYAMRKITKAVTDHTKSQMGSILTDYTKKLEEARLEAATASALKAGGNTAALSTIITQAIADGKIKSWTTEEVAAYCAANNTTDTTAAASAILAAKYEAYLENNLTEANTAYTTAYTNALTNASALSSDQDSLYPDTRKLRYGQFGLRLTGTIPSIGLDWGTSYYYGHYKQPSFDARKVDSYLLKRLSGETVDDGDKFLQYDQLQVFGLEAATVIWKLNTRYEFAYNLTQDFDGTNRAIHNNSIAWLAGFDIDLPIHNLNLNVQETGSYILKNGNIDDNSDAQAAYDVDRNSDGTYSRNKLVFVVKDTFLNEKLSAEAQVIWGIENRELCIAPRVDYNVAEGLTFTARGAWIYSRNENGEFYNFTEDSEHHDKAFVQLSAKYQF